MTYNPCKESFDEWWYNEGSGMGPKPDEDRETHVKRVTEIAWSNGAYKMLEAVASGRACEDTMSNTTSQQKIAHAVEVCGVERVWDSLDEFVKSKGGEGAANLTVNENGSVSVYPFEKDASESSLDEFVEWAKENNK